MTLGLYIHGTSPLHRLPAGAKVPGLAAAGIALFLTAEPLLLGAVLLAVLALPAAARLPWREVLRQVRPALVLLLLIFAVHAVLTDWRLGLVIVLRFAILILLATLVTLTTRVSDMIETIERGLRPLAVLGLNPAKLSLMLSLTIRFVPLLFTQLQEIREAQRSRGLDRSLVAVVVPLLIRTLRMANDLTEAIEARCYDAD